VKAAVEHKHVRRRKPTRFFIRVAGTAEITVSRTTFAATSTGRRLQFEQKDGYALCLQRIDVQGTSQWLAGERAVRILGGQSLLADLRQRQTGIVYSDVDCISFYIPCEVISRFSQENGLPEINALSVDSGVILNDTVIAHLGECVLSAFRVPGFTNQLFLYHVARAVLSHLTTNYGKPSAINNTPKGGLARWQERRSKDLLIANIDGRIGLEELARACGLSRSHFARAFKRTTGSTPMQWQLRRRVDRAKDLLLRPDLHIDQIASQCGFADSSHFIRAFVVAVGETPGAWRRARRY
jgi:AraC-like DNA-binding protein